MGKKNKQSSQLQESSTKQKLLNYQCVKKNSNMGTKVQNKNKHLPRVTQDPVDEAKNNLKNKEIQRNDDIKPDNSASICNNHKALQSKRTVFIDDVPHKVKDHSGETSLLTKQDSLQKQDEFENEDSVQDEDIDKFCDELSPDDNEQFENWVKLIEAKLHSKK
ncbi:unnamed protein product [Diatraea saccharalis]|uniref:Uncharacterized protein n=1 Tax=Diatraea saccharalis TaxID=40085 RepID=A0A9N9WCA9_9NEOP|nr:unnamed protein product [Diatraea saccharalis]